MKRSKGVFQNGRVHVRKSMCATCIFRPGNVMQLRRGRVASMVGSATKNESCIPCHETTHGQQPQQAVCHGFFSKHATVPLRVAAALDLITWHDD